MQICICIICNVHICIFVVWNIVFSSYKLLNFDSNSPSPINSVSNTSVTKILAFLGKSPSSPTVNCSELFGTTLILSATLLCSRILRQHSAMGLNASQATMESAPSFAAIIERRPVPVPGIWKNIYLFYTSRFRFINLPQERSTEQTTRTRTQEWVLGLIAHSQKSLEKKPKSRILTPKHWACRVPISTHWATTRVCEAINNSDNKTNHLSYKDFSYLTSLLSYKHPPNQTWLLMRWGDKHKILMVQGAHMHFNSDNRNRLSYLDVKEILVK